jgi:cytochrome c-type biogenesis protein CcmH
LEAFLSVILWLILGAITLAVVVALLRPLLSAVQPDLPRAAYDLQVYRDQLAEVTRDQARGVLAASEAEAATREIKRRALAAASDETAPRAEAPGRTARRWTALAIAAAVPIAALAIYLAVGFPNAPDAPFAARQREAKASAGKMPDINTALQRLEGELKTNPNDLSGWLLLARSYQALGRDGDAVGAYRHAAELKPDTPEIVAAYAEAMVMADNGAVTPEAKKLFERVAAQDPKSLPARFYLGLARAQAGDGTGAVRAWLAIEAEAPKDAPWLPALQAQIGKTAKEFGLDPTKLAPAPEPKTPPAAPSTAK